MESQLEGYIIERESAFRLSLHWAEVFSFCLLSALIMGNRKNTILEYGLEISHRRM